MKTVFVKSLRHSYRIAAGGGLLKSCGKLVRGLGLQGKVFILTQRAVSKYYLRPVRDSLKKAGFRPHVYMLPDGEVAKSAPELMKVYRELVLEGFERGDILMALGGGVAGDLGGFAASTYLRGIPFINAATTLLAQVDSAIGGKTGINLQEGKNLVGTFYPPRLVVSDTGTLVTLPARELCASFAEVVKYGMIRDPVLFRLLERNAEKALAKDPGILETMVLRSSRIKAAVVTRDEFETRGERVILNYGHTFGHAFEKAGNYRRLLHGEAVSIGMVCAARLAVLLRRLRPEVEERQRKLLEKLKLPVKLKGGFYRTETVMTAMMRDKKREGGKLRFVLPERIGRVLVFDRVPAPLVRRVLREAGTVGA